MAGSDPQPKKATPPRPANNTPRKPLQVMHISRKTDEQIISENPSEKDFSEQTKDKRLVDKVPVEKNISRLKKAPESKKVLEESPSESFPAMTMEDLLRSEESNSKIKKVNSFDEQKAFEKQERKVDEFDFDEDEFLAALEENQPIGTTGEIAKGSVIAIESDGIYVDIGGKAPGFMPKNECGLGVITNLKERFPKGLEVEVLVTREQNADGMVTISCRALELRKSWDKVQNLAKEGKVIRVKINGFNRGGVTCDFEGLRGFIPRSQLEDGENHQSLVSKTINAAFLEVNPERRKLVLSEKKAAIASRFSELEIGQLIEGEILTIKPYGFFVDLKGVSGLLHHSMVTNGSMRSLREVFQTGESIKALITDLDPSRGRIGLNTAILEGPPGELITDKSKVMEEAEERAIKARNSLNKEKVEPQKEEKNINLPS
ncbi:S1 RNA-binding domain-containing protein [Prochlorococcus marinus]|uniref:30S ribosomal protein S1 n=1 Tax=Prochlorococcus marinus XMU1408 TaxID=2213228 RepID=A0A318R1C1_PROMR|nr:S1 RNA-binding domain-containing protein [Prochlorococcus marinus]MBW3041557.1 30S ribosomal protein S1 [Prochlorococcus marinus str. XMU1408]PYE03267.1 30S ribosomal protein S1 [Prochlorococcus marinus XMU1408]